MSVAGTMGYESVLPRPGNPASFSGDGYMTARRAVLVAGRELWWFAPKFPPGHCPCGYDLTGNVSETCPECGIEDRIE